MDNVEQLSKNMKVMTSEKIKVKSSDTTPREVVSEVPSISGLTGESSRSNQLRTKRQSLRDRGPPKILGERVFNRAISVEASPLKVVTLKGQK